MNNDERDELLIRLDERQQTIHDCLKSHLAKHWKMELLFIGSLVSLVTGVLIAFAA